MLELLDEDLPLDLFGEPLVGLVARIDGDIRQRVPLARPVRLQLVEGVRDFGELASEQI